MERLLPHAERAGALLKARKETIAVGESSSGGLVAAALLAVPGASAYFIGGAILYTRQSLLAFTEADEQELRSVTPGTEASALMRARLVRERLSATWGVSESGVAGPAGSRYGYAPGHSCIAVSGPAQAARTVETGSSDRVENMYVFAIAALELLTETLEKSVK
jgi:PncC family amidohydrolase